MKKRYYLLSILIILGALGVSSQQSEVKNREVASLKQKNAIPMKTQNQKTNALKVAEENKKEPSTITKREIRSLRDSFPENDQLKAQIQRNPHSTPKALLSFAKQLGPLMEKALKNETDAKVLMSEFQACALDETVAVAGRALCVQDTEKLAELHPHMKNKASELRSSVSPEVKKILDTNDSFIVK
jgi:hypothetical protein